MLLDVTWLGPDRACRDNSSDFLGIFVIRDQQMTALENDMAPTDESNRLPILTFFEQVNP
jgi:hypothetical protein